MWETSGRWGLFYNKGFLYAHQYLESASVMKDLCSWYWRDQEGKLHGGEFNFCSQAEWERHKVSPASAVRLLSVIKILKAKWHILEWHILIL